MDGDRPHPKPHRFARILVSAALLAGLAYAVGFGVFFVMLPQPQDGAPKADAIIALTGDGDRLTPAVKLLESGSAKRLLITGVNPATSKRQLRSLLHGGAEFDCCADLGFAAEDTRGNAEEAARWMLQHRFRSAVVITAAYHMPRSLIEFHAAMPGVQLIPYPVAIEAPVGAGWSGLRRLSGEYTKYLASYVRTEFLDAKRDT